MKGSRDSRKKGYQVADEEGIILEARMHLDGLIELKGDLVNSYD